jgi:hypothetical protein
MGTAIIKVAYELLLAKDFINAIPEGTEIMFYNDKDSWCEVTMSHPDINDINVVKGQKWDVLTPIITRDEFNKYTSNWNQQSKG